MQKLKSEHTPHLLVKQLQQEPIVGIVHGIQGLVCSVFGVPLHLLQRLPLLIPVSVGGWEWQLGWAEAGWGVGWPIRCAGVLGGVQGWQAYTASPLSLPCMLSVSRLLSGPAAQHTARLAAPLPAPPTNPFHSVPL